MTILTNTSGGPGRRILSLRRAHLLALAGLAFLGGCGDGGPKLVPVSGKLYFGDKPLAGVQITFQPDGAGTDLKPAVDYTGPDGAFKLRTGEGRGAMVGRYKVLVSTDQQQYGRGLDKYAQPKTSTAFVDVPPEGLKDYELRLK